MMTNLWSSGIELMLLGMGSVFVFLALLVIGMIMMSAVLNRYSPINNNKPVNNITSESEVAAVAAAAWAMAKKTSKKS